MTITETASIAMVIMTICICIMIYLVFRNQWVYSKRINLLYNDISEYNKLLEYGDMLYKRFWIWDIEKLKKGNQNGKR